MIIEFWGHGNQSEFRDVRKGIISAAELSVKTVAALKEIVDTLGVEGYKSNGLSMNSLASSLIYYKPAKPANPPLEPITILPQEILFVVTAQRYNVILHGEGWKESILRHCRTGRNIRRLTSLLFTTLINISSRE